MIKFIHKEHLITKKEGGKVVIYYNLTDIFLGIILMALVIFFIHDYLSHALPQENKDVNAYIAPPFVIHTSTKNPTTKP